VNRKYTAAHLAFIKRRQKMPRRELLALFRRKFRRVGMTLLRLQDLCNRNGWKVGSTGGRSRGSRKYSKAELAFVRRRRKMARRELHAGFVKMFRRKDVTFENIKQLCVRNGWETDPRDRRRRTIGRTKFSKAERLWLKRRQTMPRREFWAAYVDKFGRDISLEAFKALGDRLGLRTGRTGRIEKGHVPANKGKKMPYNANSARTQFKKGQLSGRALERQKPIGSERFSKEGYLERKIHNGMPQQSRWRTVQRINWEKKHGPVPKGHVLKCLDGNKLNTAPSNWDLISRAVLAVRNKRFAGAAIPPELERTAIVIAKLDLKLGEQRRKAAQS
jgi:hypothetical protein